MDDVEHGVRCDFCGHIYAPEDTTDFGGELICDLCADEVERYLAKQERELEEGFRSALLIID